MTINKDFLKANHAALLQEIVAEALAADAPARAQTAADAERTRIQGVLAVALPGHEALVNTLAFDGKTTPAEAALKVNEAEKAKRAGALANLNTDAAAAAAALQASASAAAQPAPAASAAPAAPAAGVVLGEAQAKAQAKAEWDADAIGAKKLLAEFGTESVFTSFRTAQLRGLVKFQRRAA